MSIATHTTGCLSIGSDACIFFPRENGTRNKGLDHLTPVTSPRMTFLFLRKAAMSSSQDLRFPQARSTTKGPEIALRSYAHREGRAVAKAADSSGVTVLLCWETRHSAPVPSDDSGAEDTDIAAWL